MNEWKSILFGILLATALMLPSAVAINQSMNVSLVIPAPAPPPPPPSGLETALTGAGTGLAGFLTFSQSPLVNFIFAVGLIAGVLIVLYGIVEMVKRAFNTSDIFIEADEDERPLLDED